MGSGGNRVCTRPPYLLVLRSSLIMLRMKSEGAVASDAVMSLLIGHKLKLQLPMAFVKFHTFSMLVVANRLLFTMMLEYETFERDHE